MKKSTNERSKIGIQKTVTIYYPLKEWLELKKRIDNSTCRSASEFVRNAVKGKPIAQYYRNKSFDEFIDECIAVRKEMQAIRETVPLDATVADRLVSIYEKIYYLINKLVDDVRENNQK